MDTIIIFVGVISAVTFLLVGSAFIAGTLAIRRVNHRLFLVKRALLGIDGILKSLSGEIASIRTEGASANTKDTGSQVWHLPRVPGKEPAGKEELEVDLPEDGVDEWAKY